jgi:hypothetical protein
VSASGALPVAGVILGGRCGRDEGAGNGGALTRNDERTVAARDERCVKEADDLF